MTFDDWLDSIIPRNDHTWREDWDEDQINAAHDAWNACNRYAREECASICQGIKDTHWDSERGEGAEACEQAIRETTNDL
jgi:hypothetical protein